jgi:hypothetical protein
MVVQIFARELTLHRAGSRRRPGDEVSCRLRGWKGLFRDCSSPYPALRRCAPDSGNDSGQSMLRFVVRLPFVMLESRGWAACSRSRMRRRPSRRIVRRRGADRACGCGAFQCSQELYSCWKIVGEELRMQSERAKKPVKRGRARLKPCPCKECLRACRSGGAALPSQILTVI